MIFERPGNESPDFTVDLQPANPNVDVLLLPVILAPVLERRSELDVVRRGVDIARTEQLTLLAAGVAFYAFLSFVPLALLVVAIAASIGGEGWVEGVSEAAADVLTPTAQQFLAESIADDVGRQGATVVGALGLLWGGSRVLRGLDRAFAKVYGTGPPKSILATLSDAALVTLIVTIGLGIVAGIEAATVLLPEFDPGLLGPLGSLVVLFVAFYPLYLIFPEADVTPREAIPGAVIAAVGWFLLGRTFSLYAGFATASAIYGALGGVFLVLVWLYVGAIVLVGGAVCNAVLADRDSDRQLQSPGTRQFSSEAMTDDATGADEPHRDDDVRHEDRGEEVRHEDRGEDVYRVDTDEGADQSTRDEWVAAEDRESTRTHHRAGDRVSARTRDRADDPEALREEIERLTDRLESFETQVESRTVEKASLEAELKRYVRRRVRHSHAHGWGPYLVLLYGTALAIAAFYFLDGGWAILAMFVVWTSVLGVYLLMVLFGAGISLLNVPGRLRDRFGEWRS